ncbi:MAG TPA: acyl-CoA dehydrogenase family protein [Solirubrobacteraceae bacterium]|jgi:alkylation response protein AidB-like acyl-CoA dehydrogenase|nr:acyl-CoA dehydrogenase family protein [Solirubrobacteraceae bacterium]
MTAALDFHLNQDQRDLYERTRELATETLAPIAAAGEPGRVNRPLVAALADHGLLARLFERDHVSAIELCLIREGLARGCTEAETAFALQGLGAYPIVQAGSDALKAQWIPRVAAGTAVAAFALTEPDAGSDPAALSLHAAPDGDGGYRLSGEKLWISNAPDADVYTVFARSAAATGARGLTAFAVPGDAPGLSGEPRDMLAAHAIGSLTFDDVPVGPEQVLGEPGEGFRVAMWTLDLFRPSVGAFAIGMARTALELATAYALERETFGKPLKEHQAVAHRLAELHAQTEAARLLVHQAALAHDARISDPGVAAMAKLLATEVAQAAVDAAVQFHGAVALEQGHPLEHLYRDVRAPRIYEGASEIQREIIARAMFRAAEQ